LKAPADKGSNSLYPKRNNGFGLRLFSNKCKEFSINFVKLIERFKVQDSKFKIVETG
jgi:hypothetical protein